MTRSISMIRRPTGSTCYLMNHFYWILSSNYLVYMRFVAFCLEVSKSFSVITKWMDGDGDDALTCFGGQVKMSVPTFCRLWSTPSSELATQMNLFYFSLLSIACYKATNHSHRPQMECTYVYP